MLKKTHREHKVNSQLNEVIYRLHIDYILRRLITAQPGSDITFAFVAFWDADDRDDHETLNMIFDALTARIGCAEIVADLLDEYLNF